MIDIRILGRAGQGAPSACQVLASAFLRTRRAVGPLGFHGGERWGAPVTAFLHVETPPRTPGDGADSAGPVLLLALDPTLLGEVPFESLRGAAVLVVNSPVAPCGWSPLAPHVVAVDASAIAADAGLGPDVCPVMLGAFAAATGMLSLDDVTAAVETAAQPGPAAHVRACVAGYRAAAGVHETEVVGVTNEGGAW